MYAVVGCSQCAALWIIEGRPETCECPRCGQRRGYEKRRKFHTTDDADEAREVRARLLARRQDLDEAFDAVETFAALSEQIDDAGVDDETYLEESGLDPDAVADAGERASATGGRSSRTETVRAALRELDEPDDGDVRAYCEERCVSPAFAEDYLETLVRAGEVTEQGGTYRLL